MKEELKIQITAETTDLKKEVAEAKNEINKFETQLKKASKKVDDNFQKMGESIKESIKNGISKGVELGKKALTGLTAAIGLVTKGTEEYRSNQSKLVSAFETAGASAETAKNVYNDLYKVLGESDTAVEASNHLAQMTTNQKELSEWTNICQGVYATFGASLPIEGLTEAANETAKVGTVTGSLADALNWAGISEDAFNESLAKCNTEAERERLIRETLNGLYDEASGKFAENNKKVIEQREAQAKLQETLAKLGESLAPVVTSFTNFLNEALVPILPIVADLADKYGPLLQEALSGMYEIVSQIIPMIVDNLPIIATIAGIITGIVAAIGLYNAVAAVKAAITAAEVTTVWGLVSAYAAQAVAMATAIAPYVLIVAAIAAIIAIIVLCIKHADKIKEAFKNFVKETKEDLVEVGENIGKAMDDIGELISIALNAIGDFFKNFVDSVINFFTGLKDGAITIWNNMKETAISTFNNMKDGVVSKIQNLKDKATSIFDKVKSTIKEKIDGAKDAVKGAIDKIKGFFDFKFKWPKIPMPKFSISPSGWKVGDLLKGSIPKLSIKWNAVGGVFDKPIVFGYGGSLQGIGENGAEAVVPLEKNTKWLDKMAAMLADKMGNNRDIILQIDGKTFAQVTIDSMNNLTRQRGTLGLNIL